MAVNDIRNRVRARLGAMDPIHTRVAPRATFDTEQFLGTLPQRSRDDDALAFNIQTNQENQRRTNQTFSQRMTQAFGRAVGGIGSALGFMGEAFSPVRATEFMTGLAREVGQGVRDFGRMAGQAVSTPITLRGKDREQKTIDRELKKYRDMFQRGELSQEGYQRILGLLQNQSQELGRRTEEYGKSLPRARDVVDAGVDVATAATLVPGVVRGVGKAAVRGLPRYIRTTAGAMTVPGAYARTGPTGPGVLLSKLGRAGQALNVGKNVIARPFRTPIAKAAGALGTEAIKTRLKGEVATRFMSDEQRQRIRGTRLMKDGPLKTALEVAWGVTVPLPYVARIGNFIKKNSQALGRAAAYDDISRAIERDAVAAGVNLDRKIPIAKQLGGGETTLRESLLAGVARYGDDAGEEAKNLSGRTWESFKRSQIARGAWTGDFSRDILQFENWLRGGPEQVPGRGFDELAEAATRMRGTHGQLQLPGGTKWSRTADGEPFARETGGVMLSDEGAVGSFLERADDVGMRFADSGDISQAGTTFDMTQRFTRPQLTRAQEMVSDLWSGLRRTRLGRIFLTKVETGALMRDLDNNTLIGLKDEFEPKVAIRIKRNLEKALRKYESPIMPIGTIKNLRSSAVKEALVNSGVPAEKSGAVLKILTRAFDDTLKQNDIFSLKSKVGKRLSAFNQADRAYMASRFGLRPFFWLMQMPESTVWSGPARDKITHPVARNIFSKIFAQPEYGKKARAFYDKVGGKQMISPLDKLERPEAISERIKRMKGQSAFFIQNFTEEIAKTPAGRELIKKHGTVDNIPFVRDFLRTVKESDEPAVVIQRFIQDNRIRVGGKIKDPGAKGIQTGEDMVRKVAATKGAERAANQSSFVQLYSSARTPAERMLHPVMFPFSYVRKVVGEGGRYLVRGTAARPVVADAIVNEYVNFRNRVEDAAVTNPRLRPVVRLMSVYDPLGTEFPLSPGGLPPFYRTIDRIIHDPERYDPTTLEGANELIKSLSPAIREYQQYVGFGYNVLGKEEPRTTRFFFPQFLERNRQMQEGGLFRRISE